MSPPRALSIADLPRLPDLEFEKDAPGMAPGHDALALARLAPLRRGDRALDLGTGQGVVSLMLAAREAVEVVGIEREPAAIRVARRNGLANARLLKGSVAWICADLRDLAWNSARFAGFDLVTMNPPFVRAGTGRLPPGPARAAARHEIHGTLGDWIAAAARSLRAGGRAVCIQRLARRDETMRAMAAAGLSIEDEVRLNAKPGLELRWIVVTSVLKTRRRAR